MQLFTPLDLERKRRRKSPIQQAAWRGAITFRQETEAASGDCGGESQKENSLPVSLLPSPSISSAWTSTDLTHPEAKRARKSVDVAHSGQPPGQRAG